MASYARAAGGRLGGGRHQSERRQDGAEGQGWTSVDHDPFPPFVAIGRAGGLRPWRLAASASFAGSRLARIYVLTGDYDAAIDPLEHALSVPSIISVPLLRFDPLWDPLRDHPRFQRIIRK